MNYNKNYSYDKNRNSNNLIIIIILLLIIIIMIIKIIIIKIIVITMKPCAEERAKTKQIPTIPLKCISLNIFLSLTLYRLGGLNLCIARGRLAPPPPRKKP